MGGNCSAQDAETPLVIERHGNLSLGGEFVPEDSTKHAASLTAGTSGTSTSQEELIIQDLTSKQAFFHRDNARKRSRHWQFLKQEYRGVFCQVKLLDAKHVSDRWVGKLKRHWKLEVRRWVVDVGRSQKRDNGWYD
eukprot:UN02076